MGVLSPPSVAVHALKRVLQQAANSPRRRMLREVTDPTLHKARRMSEGHVAPRSIEEDEGEDEGEQEGEDDEQLVRVCPLPSAAAWSWMTSADLTLSLEISLIHPHASR